MSPGIPSAKEEPALPRDPPAVGSVKAESLPSPEKSANRLSAPAPSSLDTPAYVVLTGNPNCGKTTLFNALTGLRAKVGNYAGVTVERKEGRLLGAPAELNV